MNFLSTQWSTDGSTSSDPMGLCITSITPWALSAKAITHCEVHCLGCHFQTWHRWPILEFLVRGRQRAVCGNQHRAICPGDWKVLDSIWPTERGRQGPPVVPAGCCHPHSSNESLAWLQKRFPDRLISCRCDQQWSPHSPYLNPPDFYLWRYLKARVNDNNPQTIPDLKAEIRAMPREEWGRVIEKFARQIQMCLQRRGAHLEHIFLSASETKSVCSTDLKLWRWVLHRLAWPNVAEVLCQSK